MEEEERRMAEVERESVQEVISVATLTGDVELKDAHIERFASLMKRSKKSVRVGFGLLLQQLRTDHSQVRLLSSKLLDYLVRKSKSARELAEYHIQTLFSLIIGHEESHPLPPPFSYASLLRDFGSRVFFEWGEDFKEMHRLHKALQYLKNRIFPNLAPIKLSRVEFLELQSLSQTALDQQTLHSESDLILDENRPRSLSDVLKSFKEYDKHIELTTRWQSYVESLYQSLQSSQSDHHHLTQALSDVAKEGGESFLITFAGDRHDNMNAMSVNEKHEAGVDGGEDDDEFEDVEFEEDMDAQTAITEAESVLHNVPNSATENVLTDLGLGSNSYRLDVSFEPAEAATLLNPNSVTTSNVRASMKTILTKHLPFIEDSIDVIVDSAMPQNLKRWLIRALFVFRRRMDEVIKEAQSYNIFLNAEDSSYTQIENTRQFQRSFQLELQSQQTEQEGKNDSDLELKRVRKLIEGSEEQDDGQVYMEPPLKRKRGSGIVSLSSLSKRKPFNQHIQDKVQQVQRRMKKKKKRDPGRVKGDHRR